MQHKRMLTRSVLAAVAFMALAALFLIILAPTEAAPAHEEAATAEWEVIADGLANPRGLIFGPDGALYVAEAGAGGDGACVPDPEDGDRCYGETGAITQVTFDAAMAPTAQTQIITGVGSLASEVNGAATGGPTAVAFVGNDMYFTTGYGGDPADLLPAGPFGADGAEFARIMAAGPGDAYASWVDMGAYEAAEDPDEDGPDTNPFDLLASDQEARAIPAGGFLVVDAGANALLQVTETGVVSTVAVFPAVMVEYPPGSGEEVPMHAVPTSVVVGPDGAYYVSQLTGFPFPTGGASVWRVEPGSDPEVYAGGFTNILDLAFAADGSLYVLEMFTRGMLSEDPTGAITRIDGDGSRTVVAREGLITPTDLTIGPDHALYVTNSSTSPTDGAVVRIPTKLSEAGNFAAFLNGGEETPPVETGASGVSRMSLADDGTLSWEVAVWAIENITAAHIHLGAPGVAGPPVITLYNGTGDFDPDNPISGDADLTDEQVADLLAGNYYVNVHTTENPAGEIRGQIYPARTWAFGAYLSGANEEPAPIDSDATGQAFLTLSADMTELHYRVLVADIEGVTASHIHQAPAGTNGGVIFPVYTGGPPPFDESNPVSGTLAPDLTQVAAMLAGDYYVNVHTTAHPGGEIRGQIWPGDVPAGFHSLLTGREENPVVQTDAVGVATYWLSADLSMLDFHMAVRDIDNVTAAHLHTGWAGQNGGVAHPLFLGGPPPFDPDNPVNGLIALDAQSVLDLWSGYYYTNVHSTDYPPGEIRGQVEGASVFGATLNGASEVPPNGSAATGGAVLALSDDASMLYYRVMVDNIEHITASHIHLGEVGVNGGVVFTLYNGTGDFDPDNPVSGSVPMSDENVLDLVAGDYYVNVHTEHLPAGEIRGQIWAKDAPGHYWASLDGEQEVPPVDTPATGWGRFTLDGGRNTLHWYVGVEDIDNVTVSHIHRGPFGVNGPPVIFLFSGGGVFDPDNPVGSGAMLDAQGLVDLLTGYFYANVHTTDYPNGEIRGQIWAAPSMAYMPAVQR